MNITLDPELEARIRGKLARRDYESVDALVEQAVQSLIETDDVEDSQIDEIKRKIQAAEAEIDDGNHVEYDVRTLQNLAKDVHARIEDTTSRKMNIRLARSAIADLDEIWIYVADPDGIAAAERF